MTLLPEIQSAKKMLSFAKKNPNAFKGQRFEFPMLFGFFKLSTAFLCFAVNVAIMAKSETIEDVVKDFVAAEIIATIDELMLSAVSSEDRIDDMQLLISIDRMKRDDIDIARKFLSCFENRSTEERYRDDLRNGEYIRPLTCAQSFILAFVMFVYRIISILYHVIYFYGAPFWIMFLVIYANLLKNEEC